MNYLSGVTTLRFEPAACTGCGRCLEVCPREVFEGRNAKVAVIDPDRCMECGACMASCEHRALACRRAWAAPRLY